MHLFCCFYVSGTLIFASSAISLLHNSNRVASLTHFHSTLLKKSQIVKIALLIKLRHPPSDLYLPPLTRRPPILSYHFDGPGQVSHLNCFVRKLTRLSNTFKQDTTLQCMKNAKPSQQRL